MLWAHFPFLSTLETSETLRLPDLFPKNTPKIEPLVRYYQPPFRTVTIIILTVIFIVVLFFFKLVSLNIITIKTQIGIYTKSIVNKLMIYFNFFDYTILKQ